LGIEMVATRKNEKKSEHHKILVKEPLLRKIVEETAAKDEYYIPMPGKIVSFCKFYSFVCQSTNNKKKLAELETEKMSIAKANSFEQINAMEKQALLTAEDQFKVSRDELNEKRSELELKVSNVKTLEEIDSYNLVKETMDYQRLEIDKALIEKRAKISSYYLSIRNYREAIDIKRASVMEEKNRKRRFLKLFKSLN
jgi:hypothetical protein